MPFYKLSEVLKFVKCSNYFSRGKTSYASKSFWTFKSHYYILLRDVFKQYWFEQTFDNTICLKYCLYKNSDSYKHWRVIISNYNKFEPNLAYSYLYCFKEVFMLLLHGIMYYAVYVKLLFFKRNCAVCHIFKLSCMNYWQFAWKEPDHGLEYTVLFFTFSHNSIKVQLSVTYVIVWSQIQAKNGLTDCKMPIERLCLNLFVYIHIFLAMRI